MPIRKGDKVTINFLVTEDENQCGWFEAKLDRSPGANSIKFYKDEVACHTPAPRPIEVGCKVKYAARASEFKILAIDGEEAWLLNLSNSTRFTTRLYRLTRID